MADILGRLDMTRNPWWFSGDESEPDAESAGAESKGPGLPSFDLAALAGTAQRLVDWASERIMAPHADHDDAREHPQCVVCRTLLLLGEGSTSAANGAPESTDAVPGIAWIPIVDGRDEP